jgi:alkanesulfonate monooxygenase SsuD/methylene tetrahydromethanopterin reductase-like flavin-dependent oxidoreductase (luciferase family)
VKIQAAIAIPQTSLSGQVRPDALRDFLVRAEALGYHSAWVVERVLGAITALEAVTLMTWAAAHTRRMKLGSAVLLTALRSPVHLAKALATLDQLSGGRVIVGVGLGGDARVYPSYGLPGERRAARFTEGVTLMKRLWSEPRVTFAGEFYRLQDAAMEPKPVQTPLPLWFGAHHPDALRRAVELGTGFMGAGSSPTSQFVEEVKLLRAMLAEARRDPATFPIGKRVYLAIDRDRARAGKRLAEWFGAFYGRPALAEQVSVFGSAQECIDGLGSVVRGGAELLLLNPVFDEMEHLDQLAADVLPRL